MDLNRREFLSYSAVTGTAILFNEIAAYSKPLKSLIAPGFELLVLATNWGFDGSWDQFCSKIKSLGYTYPAQAVGEDLVCLGTVNNSVILRIRIWQPVELRNICFVANKEIHLLVNGYVGIPNQDPYIWS